jgi:putative ABC transport system permease protein
LSESIEGMRFRVHDQSPEVSMSIVIRSPLDTEALAASVRDAITALNPRATVSDVAPMAGLVARSTALPRFRSLMLTGLAGVAAILAMLGVYGVVALSVAERRREIGVRMTLGAKQTDILKQVLAGGTRLIFAGVLLGLATAAATVRWLESYLYEVRITDPATFGGVAVAVIAVAVFATWIPARRAALIEPMIVLRRD